MFLLLMYTDDFNWTEFNSVGRPLSVQFKSAEYVDPVSQCALQLLTAVAYTKYIAEWLAGAAWRGHAWRHTGTDVMINDRYPAWGLKVVWQCRLL